VLLASTLYSIFGAVGLLGDNFVDFLDSLIVLIRQRVLGSLDDVVGLLDGG
jgi:hypothetical protein